MMRPDVRLATAWHFPTPTVVHLDSGLTLWHFDLPGQHVATFDVVLPAPLTHEPRGLEGVANVALHAIDEGTLSHPDGEIGELLEAQGATLHGTTRHRYTTFGGQAPSRRLTDVLPLFREVLTQPAYAERDVAHHVEAQIAGYESRLASPGSANRLALRAALYDAGHRDARPASGTPETLEHITAEVAAQWHRNHFSPAGATLVVAGATGLDEVLDGVSSWQAPPPVRDGLRPTSPLQQPRVVVLDHPGAVQATIAMATRTVTRQDPRWPALRVAGHAMAGAFASRLNLELRERLGYTYGIGGGFAPGVDEGQFTVGTSVRTEVAGDAVARVLDALGAAEPFTGKEAEDARQFLIGIAPLANETSADIVNQACTLAASGLGPEYLNAHFAQLAAVTAEEATAAFREVIDPGALTIAVTGEAAELVPALEQLGLAVSLRPAP
ncbi:M16 family metallopeptidase [Tessaracoccus massiliensis]|uniref:M16 family metallopeptidase n=1 Tax=Tessaracoccus massiliensis TaxID=1522311 RepID=UPI0005909E18|nr:pitrilysin family protein [Tessaracoccus massiliensis]